MPCCAASIAARPDDAEFKFVWVNGPEEVARAVDRAVEEARGATPGPAPTEGLAWTASALARRSLRA
jgi:hypothetical protein